MLKVLHVNYGMGCGGTEALLVNLHRNIDRDRLQFDYFAYRAEKQYYEDAVEELGGKIWHSRRPRDLGICNMYKAFCEFLKHHPEYRIVHCHAIYAVVQLMAARKFGRIGIAHSHSTAGITMSSLKSIIITPFIYPARYLANYLFACSPQAGIDRFGKKATVRFLRNGIDTSKHTFSPATRRAVRAERGISSEDTLVLGHVGSFSPVKNHKFLVEVFSAVHSRVPNSKLWLLGGGKLEDEIRAQVHALGLDDAVDFVGITDKVSEYLMGMDVFVFPSHFEGMGNALIEAEASGLPCVCSEAIQDEAVVSDRVRRLRLGHPPST